MAQSNPPVHHSANWPNMTEERELPSQRKIKSARGKSPKYAASNTKTGISNELGKMMDRISGESAQFARFLLGSFSLAAITRGSNDYFPEHIQRKQWLCDCLARTQITLSNLALLLGTVLSMRDCAAIAKIATSRHISFSPCSQHAEKE